MKKIIFSLWLLSMSAIVYAQQNSESQEFGNFSDHLFIKHKTLLFDAKLEAKIGEIGADLIAVCECPEMNFTFRIISDSLINAYAASGGYVYINTGLLDVLESKEELAAVLAHEIAHSCQDHPLKNIYNAHRRKELAQIGARMAGIALGALIGQSLNLTATADIEQLLDLTETLGAMAGVPLGQSLAQGYGRQLELKADKAALVYLKDAGYDPHALLHVFKKFKSIQDRIDMDPQNPYSSHLLNAKPGLDRRLEKGQDRLAPEKSTWKKLSSKLSLKKKK